MLRSICAVLIVAAASSAPAATPKALLTTGDTVGSATVSSLEAIATNQNGGWGAIFSDTTGADTLDYITGTADGVSPLIIIAQEGLVGGLTIEGLNTQSFGFTNAGEAVYDANTANSIDALYRGSTVLLKEGDAIASTSGTYNIINRPQATVNGDAQFVSSISTGSLTGGLFADSGSTLRYGTNSGAGLIGIPSGAQSANVDFDHAIAPDGSHWINVVNLTSGFGGVTPADNTIMVLDGTVIQLGGSDVRESITVPVSVGGDGAEAWENFDSFGVSNAGDYLITGNTDTAGANTEFLLVNGQIVAKEGGVLDGVTLAGTIRDAEMGADGDWAVIWGDGSGDDVLFVNGLAVAKVGDLTTDGAVISDLVAGNDHLKIGRNVNGAFDVCFLADTADGARSVMTLTIPEPASAGLIGVASIALLAGRRRTA